MTVLSKFQYKPASPTAQHLFTSVGTFNLVAGFLLPYLARTHPELFNSAPFPPTHLIFVDIMSELLAALGVGYYLAAQDLNVYWPFIALGVVGKSVSALMFVVYRVKGHKTNTPFWLGTVDGFVAYLFYRVLQTHAI